MHFQIRVHNGKLLGVIRLNFFILAVLPRMIDVYCTAFSYPKVRLHVAKFFTIGGLDILRIFSLGRPTSDHFRLSNYAHRWRRVIRFSCLFRLFGVFCCWPTLILFMRKLRGVVWKLGITDSAKEPFLELTALSKVELGTWYPLVKHSHYRNEHLTANFSRETHKFFKVHRLIRLECAL